MHASQLLLPVQLQLRRQPPRPLVLLMPRLQSAAGAGCQHYEMEMEMQMENQTPPEPEPETETEMQSRPGSEAAHRMKLQAHWRRHAAPARESAPGLACAAPTCSQTMLAAARVAAAMTPGRERARVRVHVHVPASAGTAGQRWGREGRAARERQWPWHWRCGAE